ncbi:MAG: hypothetical protein N3I35_06705 [Clostridia bacterium]|nr:hypothetical protein [Clostridia bacterium]
MAVFSKGAGLADSIYGKVQDPIKKFITDAETFEKKNSQIDNIFNVIPIETYGVRMGTMTTFGDFEPVGEGGEYPETSMVEGNYKFIEPDTWKSMRKVTEEMLMDSDSIGMVKVKQLFADFVPAYYRTREKFGAGILNAGNATSMTFGGKTYDIKGADSLALFSTAHTRASGARGSGTQSNYFDAPFSYDNLCKVEELMQKFTNDDGDYAGIQPDTIIIPNNARIKKLVADALWAKEDGKADSADNGYNYQAGRWHVITWNYLNNYSGITSGTDCWFVMDSKRNAIDGLTWVDRMPLTIKSFIDEYTDVNIWAGRGRYAAAPVNWLPIAACAPGLGSSIA